MLLVEIDHTGLGVGRMYQRGGQAVNRQRLNLRAIACQPLRIFAGEPLGFSSTFICICASPCGLTAIRVSGRLCTACLWKLHRHAQFAVIETVVAHHALLAVVVEHQSVSGLQKFGPAFKMSRGCQFVGITHGLFQACVIVGAWQTGRDSGALAAFLFGNLRIRNS